MTILEKIVASKHDEVADRRAERSIEALQAAAADAPPPRDFRRAVCRGAGQGIALIAEVKKASPSAGLIVPDFDPVHIASIYARGGADALSVLTDAPYFQGSLEHLTRIRDRVELPILRKDFVVDAYQIYEARVAGADAVLLIADVLDDTRLGDFADLAAQLGMTALIEVHGEENLRRALPCLRTDSAESHLLGINNRDLHRQVTRLETMEELARLLPDAMPFVAESGLSSHADLQRASRAGACAVLVGEALLSSPDLPGAVRAILGRDAG